MLEDDRYEARVSKQATLLPQYLYTWKGKITLKLARSKEKII